jgi:hypothetical protein
MLKIHGKIHYAEIGQSYPALFAWVRKEGDTFVMQHSWIKCRDFLADAIMFHGRKDYKNNIYGFKIYEGYKPENYYAIKFPAKHKEIFFKNFDEFNAISVQNGLTPAKVVHDEGDTIVLEFDPFWMKHPSMVSLFTFLVKIFSYREDNVWEKAPATEAQYIMSVPSLDKLLKNLKNLTFGKFDEGKQLYGFHDNVGFVATFKKNSTHDLNKQLKALA